MEDREKNSQQGGQKGQQGGGQQGGGQQANR